MKKILNFGSLNIDYVYAVAHTVRGGETEASRGLEVFPGGKGLNQSIAAARAGLSVFHAGLVGEDGGLLLDTLRADNVDTRFVGTVPGRSGHTIIQVDERAQNAILLFGGRHFAAPERNQHRAAYPAPCGGNGAQNLVQSVADGQRRARVRPLARFRFPAQ